MSDVSKQALETAVRRLMEHLSSKAQMNPKRQRLIEALLGDPTSETSNVIEFIRKRSKEE